MNLFLFVLPFYYRSTVAEKGETKKRDREKKK